MHTNGVIAGWEDDRVIGDENVRRGRCAWVEGEGGGGEGGRGRGGRGRGG